MKRVYIAVIPDENVDVSLGGIFTNRDAAAKCANDPNITGYVGYVWEIDLDAASDEYEPEDEE
jgi:hypothetical protein